VPHRGPYQIHGRNKNNTLLFPDPSSCSSSFFFTSQEILRQLYQQRSCVFSYRKQFMFYALSLSFTAAEYSDVVNVYGFLLWMLNTRVGFHIYKLEFDE
jgi:hypothetical protein